MLDDNLFAAADMASTEIINIHKNQLLCNFSAVPTTPGTPPAISPVKSKHTPRTAGQLETTQADTDTI
jgi:hypothetical protein